MDPSAVQVVGALNHPIRRRILRAMHEGEAASPNQLSDRLKSKLSGVAYHVRYLQKRNVLTQAGTRQVRGAREHFYRADFGQHAQWALAVLSATRSEDA